MLLEQIKNQSIIIDSDEEYVNFSNKLKVDDFFFFVLESDDKKHSIKNNISSIFVYFIEKNTWNILLINHYEKLYNIDIKIFNNTFVKKYTLNKKKILYYFPNISNLYDLNYLSLQEKNEIIQIPQLQGFNYITCNNKNNILPYLKYLENIQHVISDNKWQFKENHNKYLNDEYTKVFYEIEKSGLFIDKKIFLKYFKNHENDIIDDKIYSSYNLYNITSRPSNSFGGLNFSALNKENGERSCFVSRFKKDGIIFNIDYDAYHLRLISKLIDYNISPNLNIYKYFATYFFDKNDVTDKEIKEVKHMVFKFLYGGIHDKFNTIPYFKLVNNYIDMLWKFSNEKGYVETLLFKRKIKLSNIDDINKYKLMNYFIQSMETEINVDILSKIFNFLNCYNTKLILYTYDSFTFDVCREDGNDIIVNLIDIIKNNNQFPVKCHVGKNFHDLKNLTLNLK